MKRLSALVLAVTLAAPALAQERPSNYTVTPTDPGAVKVCSWNMEWFPSGTQTPKPAKVEEERTDSAARFLKWQNADIVLLQEMRSAEVCTNLVARPALEGFRVNVCANFRPSYPWQDAQQQDALISKFETVDSGYKEFQRRRAPAAPPRGFAWCVIDVRGELWAFVIVHFKSNRIQPWEDPKETAKANTAKREESARQVVDFVKANLEGKSYGGRSIKYLFIGGDLNTDPAQRPYAKETTVPTILDAGFIDTFADVPEDKRWTIPESRSYPASRFDWIFVKGGATLSNPEVAPKQYTSDHCMVSVQVKTASPVQAAPLCPKCGGSMNLQTSPQDGRKFWGCAKYPACRGYRELVSSVSFHRSHAPYPRGKGDPRDALLDHTCPVCGRRFHNPKNPNFVGAVPLYHDPNLWCGSCSSKYHGLSVEKAKQALATDLARQRTEAAVKSTPTAWKSGTGCSFHPNDYIEAVAVVHTMYGNKRVCEQCFQGVKSGVRCLVCKGWTAPGQGTKPSRNLVEPGVRICDDCMANKVSPDSINELYSITLKTVEDLLGRRIDCKATLLLCSYEEMQKNVKDKNTTESGLYTCETFRVTDGEASSIEEVCTIRILKWLPFDMMVDVMAHEIAHHWLHHNVSVPRTKFQEEGFAEWVAFATSRIALNENAVRGHTENDDPIYGDGFRDIWNKVESKKYPTFESLFRNAPQQRVAPSPRPPAIVCPKCGGPTELRTSPQNGKKFWGCKRYPACKGFIWADKN